MATGYRDSRRAQISDIGYSIVILADIPKDKLHLVIKDGTQVAHNAQIRGSAVIDATIPGVITEFKTSFGSIGKYQTKQFARFAKATGQTL